MTHTAEPMTLEKAKDIFLQWIAAVAGNGSMCAMAESRIKEVFAELAKQRDAEPVAWLPMNTAPRDGTVIVLRFGEDGESPGWFDSPAHPIKNEDGTWPDNPYGHPWAFIDKGSEIKHGEDVGAWFVNHARDTEYGPTHWRPYADLSHPQQRNAVEVTDEPVVERQLIDSAREAIKYGHESRGLELLRRVIKQVESYEEDRTALSAVASRDREDAEHQLRDLYRAIESNLTGSSIEQGKNPTEYKEGLIKAYGHCREMVSKRIDAIRAVRNAMNAARRENKP